MHSLINRIMPSASGAHLFAVVALAGLFIWFGLMNLAGLTEATVERWLQPHPLAYLVTPYKTWLPYALGAIQLFAGVMIAIYAVPQRWKRVSYGLIGAISIASLSLMFTNPVWIESLGGFPAIGSGQGLIKYVAILGVALWFLGTKGANEIMLIGLILVLGWIGAMKFTGPEAEGVWPLLTGSPVFNWWLTDFGKQMASNIIGVVELITVILLTGHWWNRKAYEVGLLISAATFVVTLSFLLTFPQSWSGGFPNLSGTGHFLLKDAVLLAATFILYRD
ncbi:MAG: DUF417 family protein [Kordiimonadaceae bacterium]|nr:DUF417 family protein [Kordiimonadaceae bacterium]MBO6570180.1 DUF417 family protein [Kordiimonadaceae bacterium]MBO6965722.1 DUF417 family protein [Kordiimonadaceae bacterium]